jgi:hypothetical protein
MTKLKMELTRLERISIKQNKCEQVQDLLHLRRLVFDSMMTVDGKAKGLVQMSPGLSITVGEDEETPVRLSWVSELYGEPTGVFTRSKDVSNSGQG